MHPMQYASRYPWPTQDGNRSVSRSVATVRFLLATDASEFFSSQEGPEELQFSIRRTLPFVLRYLLR